MEIICSIKVTRFIPVNDGVTVLLGRYPGRRRCRSGDTASDRLRQDEARPQVGGSRAAAAVAVIVATSAGPAVAAAGQDDPGGVRGAGQLGGE